MPPQCSLDPMDCIFQVRRSTGHLKLHKRAPPLPPADPSATVSLVISPTGTGTPTTSTGDGKELSDADRQTVIIASAVGGTLLLVVALAIFSICLKKRRASRRIHQLQGFLPTFLDKDRTERYFREKQPLSRSSSVKKSAAAGAKKKKGGITGAAAAAPEEKTPLPDTKNNASQVTVHDNGSNTTLVVLPSLPVPPPPPSQAVLSNLHNRAKSAPLARQHLLEKQASGVFQQVSLDPNEPLEDQGAQAQPGQSAAAAAAGESGSGGGGGGLFGALRRTLSGRSRQTSAPVKESLQQQQKLQISTAVGTVGGRSALPVEGSPSVLIGERALHGSDESLRFPDGEEYHLASGSRGGVPSSVEHHMDRFSSVSNQGGGSGGQGSDSRRSSSNDLMLLDPNNRLSTMSIMLDARQLEELELQQQQQSSSSSSSPSLAKRPHPHHHRTSGLSRQSTESGSSAGSSDDDDNNAATMAHLPAHQQLQSFHASPPLVMSPALPSAMPVPFVPGAHLLPQQQQQHQQQYVVSAFPPTSAAYSNMAGVGGASSRFDDKQELDEDDEVVAVGGGVQPQVGPWSSITPSPFQPPLPPRPPTLHSPVIARPHGGREMSLSASDRELDAL